MDELMANLESYSDGAFLFRSFPFKTYYWRDAGEGARSFRFFNYQAEHQYFLLMFYTLIPHNRGGDLCGVQFLRAQIIERPGSSMYFSYYCCGNNKYKK